MHHSRCASRSGTFDWSKSSVDESLRVVDISNQYLTSLPNLVIENRQRIEHLILDGNRFSEHSLNIPLFANLVTLSLNSNRIQNVGILLEHLRKQCPKLTFLSLIGNPGWPHPVSTSDFLMYSSYRQVVTPILLCRKSRKD
ncbi:unnamed protein product [Toxocara canis]|uniref:Leucine-rich repeat-containing protein C10orf11 homolog n=1 Tax=Toxocara canis TaxID=6265 RepID=A0A183V248_TOXCA|nr:unnamed protein product [Toxocara canis]